MTEAIYLSANSLNPSEAGKFNKVDIVAVNSAIVAFFDVIMGRRILAWDASPDITPHAKFVATDYGVDYESWTKVYKLQSSNDTLKSNFRKLENITHGVFLGGGQNTILEYEIFQVLHPDADVTLLPETGGAAMQIARQIEPNISIPSGRYKHFTMFLDKFGISTNDARTKTPKIDNVNPIMKTKEKELDVNWIPHHIRQERAVEVPYESGFRAKSYD